MKRLKEVGQSSKERKKWLIMLWYVVFSETAEKMKKIKEKENLTRVYRCDLVCFFNEKRLLKVN